MRRLKIITLSIAVLSCTFSTDVINAAALYNNDSPIIFEQEKCVYATDRIEYVYRMIDGIPHYRRWNATRNYWVDDEWIPL